jgi:hypothetical protein
MNKSPQLQRDKRPLDPFPAPRPDPKNIVHAELNHKVGRPSETNIGQSDFPSFELYSPPLSGKKKPNSFILFLAESIRDFDIEHSPKTSEYPFLSYSRGERFAILRIKTRNFWLACNQERNTEALGWGYSENFRRTSGVEGKALSSKGSGISLLAITLLVLRQ